jgi:hypothetical protein
MSRHSRGKVGPSCAPKTRGCGESTQTFPRKQTKTGQDWEKKEEMKKTAAALPRLIDARHEFAMS